MQALIFHDRRAELRFDPLSKRNRIGLPATKYDPRKFVKLILSREALMWKERVQERRGGLIEAARLEHVFWEIKQDPYVKEKK